MYHILDKEPTNSEKLRKEPFGHTLLTKTTDSVHILFQNVNGLKLSIVDHTIEETCNAITKLNIDIGYLVEYYLGSPKNKK